MFDSYGQNWAAICNLDADMDGKTNGVELGDPDCVWVTGVAPAGTATGHPGLFVCLYVCLCMLAFTIVWCEISLSFEIVHVFFLYL